MNERAKKSLEAVLKLLVGAKPDEYGEVIDAASRTLRRVLHPVSTRVDTDHGEVRLTYFTDAARLSGTKKR